MDSTLKTNVTRGSTWLRGLYMLLFAIIYSIAELVLFVVVVFQFFFALLAGAPNAQLLAFGQGLSRFIYQVLLYLTYNVEQRPFPFAPWPSTGPAAESTSDAERTS